MLAPLLFALSSGLAQAAQTVGVELQVDAGPPPAHVCVLTPGRGPAQVLFREADSGVQRAEDTGEPSAAQVRVRQAFSRLDAAAFTEGGAHPAGGDCDPDALPEACRPQVRAPHEAELGHFLDPEGSSDREKKYYLACRSNTRASDLVDGPVLLLLLDGVPNKRKDSPPPGLADLRLVGDAVSLTLSSPEHPVLVGSVLGGDYAPSSVRLVEDGRLVLPATPRCRRHTVQLPPTTRRVAEGEAPGLGELAFTLHGPTVPGGACTAAPDATGRVTALLETGPVLDGADLELQATTLGGSHPWLEARGVVDPVGPTVLEPHALGFQWARHPVYPQVDPAGPSCPAARLDPAGIPCAAQPAAEADTCAWRCPAEGAGAFGPFALPAAVRFEDASGTLSWSLPLGYAGETLEGFVPAEARVVPLSFAAWYPVPEGACVARCEARGQPWRAICTAHCRSRRALHERPGLGAQHIELVTPTDERRIAHLPEPRAPGEPEVEGEGYLERIPLAGAEDGDLYQVRVVGVHRDDVRLVELEHGKLEIPTPGQDRASWSWGGSLAAGPTVRRSCYWPQTNGPWACTRLQQASDQGLISEEDAEDVFSSFWMPGIAVQAAIEYWPRARTRTGHLAPRMWWLEFPLQLDLSRHGYRPIDATGEAAPRSEPELATAFWATAAPGIFFTPLRGHLSRLSLGAAGGVLYLAPVRPESRQRLDIPRATWTASMEPRYRIAPHTSLSLRASLNPARIVAHQVIGMTSEDGVFGGGIRTVSYPGLHAHAAVLVRLDGQHR